MLWMRNVRSPCCETVSSDARAIELVEEGSEALWLRARGGVAAGGGGRLNRQLAPSYSFFVQDTQNRDKVLKSSRLQTSFFNFSTLPLHASSQTIKRASTQTQESIVTARMRVFCRHRERRTKRGLFRFNCGQTNRPCSLSMGKSCLFDQVATFQMLVSEQRRCLWRCLQNVVHIRVSLNASARAFDCRQTPWCQQSQRNEHPSLSIQDSSKS